jgi:hypothetical protein
MKQRLSEGFRSRRDAHLRRVLEACPRQGEVLRILDVGGRAGYWQRLGFDYLRGLGVEITLLNLTKEEVAVPEGDGGLFVATVGSGCQLSYPDGHFDLCHSNSVIEHVGLWRDMEAFARETRRVAPSHFVQSPNYWFPIDPHFWRMPFFHWLPRPVRAGLVQSMPLASGGKAVDLSNAYEIVDSARLLTRGQMQFLFPESTLLSERVMLLPKSYTAIATGAPRPQETNLGHG